MLLPDSGPGVQQEVQRVGGPSQLPGPEIRLPALLVQIGKYQEQQERDHSWQDHRADDNAIHELTDTNPSSLARQPMWGNASLWFHTFACKTILFGAMVIPFVATGPVFCVA